MPSKASRASRILNRAEVPVRQTVLTSSVDANGYANFISAGSGLNASISASTSSPLVMAFAGGFDDAGAVDYVKSQTSNISNISVAASNTNYVYSNLNASTGALIFGSTLAPPQYGSVYNRTAQSLLHFDGTAGSTTILDDFGNTWTAVSGAKLQTNWTKFGTAALGGGGTSNALNGTSDYIKSTNFTSLGSGGWAIRGWVNPSALPGSGAYVGLFGFTVAGGVYGALVRIFNNAGTIKFTYDLSSTGTSVDIANAIQGTTTPVVGTSYFVELTFDAVAGVYRLYVNGVQETSTSSSAKVCGIAGGALGATFDGSHFFNGYIDEFEFLPYCDHPGGTTYSVPTLAKSINTAGYSSDWFDLSSFTLKSTSVASSSAGSNPTFTFNYNLYLGEAVTGSGTVTSVVNYALQGRYDSGWFAVASATTYTKSHYLGVFPLANSRILAQNSDGSGWCTVNEFNSRFDSASTVNAYAGVPVIAQDRNSVTFRGQGNYVAAFQNSAGTDISMATGYLRTILSRGW